MMTLDHNILQEILCDLLIQPIDKHLSITKINTDSRTITPGDTFVALSGDSFDGHVFIDSAIADGAQSLIVESLYSGCPIPQVVVSNTRHALARIAAHIRDDFVARGGIVIGVTGSAGKTTNKQMLASIFSEVGVTHATAGNFNNDLGVPFTWFALPDDAQFAIIEMGADKQGEIDYLAQITRPHVAMITNAGAAHLEGFGGLTGVAKGKAEIFSYLTQHDWAIINADDQFADFWRDGIGDRAHVTDFALSNENASVYARDIQTDAQRFTLCHGQESRSLTLPVAGNHNIMNALGCSCCALALSIPLDAIVRGLEKFANAPRRQQEITLGSLTIIDDSYNANPLSMRAAAEVLASTEGKYTIMAIGDMKELGDNADQLHADLGRDLAGKADAFFCLGDHMQAFTSANSDAVHFQNIDALIAALTAHIDSNSPTMLLVKGSFSMHMNRVVEALTHNVTT